MVKQVAEEAKQIAEAAGSAVLNRLGGVRRSRGRGAHHHRPLPLGLQTAAAAVPN